MLRNPILESILLPMEFPERLKWARKTAQLSQRGLASLAKLKSDAHIRHIESGLIKSVETHTVQAIARVLGCSLDWLLNGEGDEPTEAAILAAVELARVEAAKGSSEPGDAA